MPVDALPDETEEAREQQVTEVAEVLRDYVSTHQAPGLTEAFDSVQSETQADGSVLREALVRALYTGVLSLTEDRRLVGG